MAEETTAKPRTAWTRILGADDAPSKHEERLTKIQEAESTERIRLQEKGLTERARIQHEAETKRALVTARAAMLAGRLETKRAFWANNGVPFFVALVFIVGGGLTAGALVYNEWLNHTRPLSHPSVSGCVESVELSEARATDKKCPPGGVMTVTYLKDVERFQITCRCPYVGLVGAADAGVEAGGS